MQSQQQSQAEIEREIELQNVKESFDALLELLDNISDKIDDLQTKNSTIRYDLQIPYEDWIVSMGG